MADGPNHRELLILAVLTSGELYGRAIRNEYERRTKTTMPLGSLYTTLDRMEEKGFLKSRDEEDGESVKERGGNKRKYYWLTASGSAALRDFQLSMALSRGVLANG